MAIHFHFAVSKLWASQIILRNIHQQVWLISLLIIGYTPPHIVYNCPAIVPWLIAGLIATLRTGSTQVVHR